MKEYICERCLKTGPIGIHTCTPTDWARRLELNVQRLLNENERLRAEVVRQFIALENACPEVGGRFFQKERAEKHAESIALRDEEV